MLKKCKILTILLVQIFILQNNLLFGMAAESGFSDSILGKRHHETTGTYPNKQSKKIDLMSVIGSRTTDVSFNEYIDSYEKNKDKCDYNEYWWQKLLEKDFPYTRNTDETSKDTYVRALLSKNREIKITADIHDNKFFLRDLKKDTLIDEVELASIDKIISIVVLDKNVIIGTNSGDIRIWNSKTRRWITTMQTSGGEILDIAPTQNNQFITVSRDGLARQWRFLNSSLELIGKPSSIHHGVRGNMDEDDIIATTCSRDNSLKFWKQGACIKNIELEEKDKNVTCVRLFKDDKENEVEMTDEDEEKQKNWLITTHKQKKTSLEQGYKTYIKIWDWQTGACSYTHQTDLTDIYSIEMDSNYLLVASESVIQVYEFDKKQRYLHEKFKINPNVRKKEKLKILDIKIAEPTDQENDVLFCMLVADDSLNLYNQVYEYTTDKKELRLYSESREWDIGGYLDVQKSRERINDAGYFIKEWSATKNSRCRQGFRLHEIRPYALILSNGKDGLISINADFSNTNIKNYNDVLSLDKSETISLENTLLDEDNPKINRVIKVANGYVLCLTNGKRMQFNPNKKDKQFELMDISYNNLMPQMQDSFFQKDLLSIQEAFNYFVINLNKNEDPKKNIFLLDYFLELYSDKKINMNQDQAGRLINFLFYFYKNIIGSLSEFQEELLQDLFLFKIKQKKDYDAIFDYSFIDSSDMKDLLNSEKFEDTIPILKKQTLLKKIEKNKNQMLDEEDFDSETMLDKNKDNNQKYTQHEIKNIKKQIYRYLTKNQETILIMGQGDPIYDILLEIIMEKFSINNKDIAEKNCYFNAYCDSLVDFDEHLRLSPEERTIFRIIKRKEPEEVTGDLSIGETKKINPRNKKVKRDVINSSADTLIEIFSFIPEKDRLDPSIAFGKSLYYDNPVFGLNRKYLWESFIKPPLDKILPLNLKKYLYQRYFKQKFDPKSKFNGRFQIKHVAQAVDRFKRYRDLYNYIYSNLSLDFNSIARSIEFLIKRLQKQNFPNSTLVEFFVDLNIIEELFLFSPIELGNLKEILYGIFKKMDFDLSKHAMVEILPSLLEILDPGYPYQRDFLEKIIVSINSGYEIFESKQYHIYHFESFLGLFKQLILKKETLTPKLKKETEKTVKAMIATLKKAIKEKTISDTDDLFAIASMCEKLEYFELNSLETCAVTAIKSDRAQKGINDLLENDITSDIKWEKLDINFFKLIEKWSDIIQDNQKGLLGRLLEHYFNNIIDQDELIECFESIINKECSAEFLKHAAEELLLFISETENKQDKQNGYKYLFCMLINKTGLGNIEITESNKKIIGDSLFYGQMKKILSENSIQNFSQNNIEEINPVNLFCLGSRNQKQSLEILHNMLKQIDDSDEFQTRIFTRYFNKSYQEFSKESLIINPLEIKNLAHYIYLTWSIKSELISEDNKYFIEEDRTELRSEKIFKIIQNVNNGHFLYQIYLDLQQGLFFGLDDDVRDLLIESIEEEIKYKTYFNHDQLAQQPKILQEYKYGQGKSFKQIVLELLDENLFFEEFKARVNAFMENIKEYIDTKTKQKKQEDMLEIIKKIFDKTKGFDDENIRFKQKYDLLLDIATRTGFDIDETSFFSDVRKKILDMLCEFLKFKLENCSFDNNTCFEIYKIFVEKTYNFQVNKEVREKRIKIICTLFDYIATTTKDGYEYEEEENEEDGENEFINTDLEKANALLEIYIKTNKKDLENKKRNDMWNTIIKLFDRIVAFEVDNADDFDVAAENINQSIMELRDWLVYMPGEPGRRRLRGEKIIIILDKLLKWISDFDADDVRDIEKIDLLTTMYTNFLSSIQSMGNSKNKAVRKQLELATRKIMKSLEQEFTSDEVYTLEKLEKLNKSFEKFVKVAGYLLKNQDSVVKQDIEAIFEIMLEKITDADINLAKKIRFMLESGTKCKRVANSQDIQKFMHEKIIDTMFEMVKEDSQNIYEKTELFCRTIIEHVLDIENYRDRAVEEILGPKLEDYMKLIPVGEQGQRNRMVNEIAKVHDEKTAKNKKQEHDLRFLKNVLDSFLQDEEEEERYDLEVLIPDVSRDRDSFVKSDKTKLAADLILEQRQNLDKALNILKHAKLLHENIERNYWFDSSSKTLGKTKGNKTILNSGIFNHAIFYQVLPRTLVLLIKEDLRLLSIQELVDEILSEFKGGFSPLELEILKRTNSLNQLKQMNFELFLKLEDMTKFLSLKKYEYLPYGWQKYKSAMKILNECMPLMFHANNIDLVDRLIEFGTDGVVQQYLAKKYRGNTRERWAA